MIDNDIQMILIMKLKSSSGVYHYQLFTQEKTILLIKLKLSPDVYHYQSFTLEQMILSRNLKSCGAELIAILRTRSSSQ